MQMNDSHLMLLEFFPCSTDIFKDVAIADGLSIVLKDMNKTQSGFKYVYSKNGNKIEIDADCPGDTLFSLNPRDVEITKKNLTQLFQSMPVYMIRYYRKSCLALKAILLKRILHLLGNITMAIISI